ncbi:MAG TPA: hypothetical protein VFN28_02150, partial [Amaricoccus sp.]|nr:hypothetical protein [Amaricoccus sp.]
MAAEACSEALRGPDVEARSPEWGALLDAHPDATPFSGPLLQLAQRAAFAPGEEALAIETRREGRLVGFAPLVGRRMRAGPAGYRELGFLRGAHTLRNHLLHAP